MHNKEQHIRKLAQQLWICTITCQQFIRILTPLWEQ